MAEETKKTEFEKAQSQPGFLAEFWEFLKQNKKLWMIPILVVLLLLGLLIILGGTAAAPFIYTLF
jgi:hypothetical protein